MSSARNRGRHIAELLSGNLVATLIGLLATAITARALGVAGYGALALTFVYVQAVERLVTFQSWQPLIRYGAALIDGNQRGDLGQLLKFGLVLDVVGAFCAWAVAIGGALVAARLMGWDAGTTRVVLLYATVLLFNLSGMATAVLRLTGRFKVMAYGQVAGAILRLVLSAIGAWMGLGVIAFAAIWAAAQILGSMIMMAMVFRILREFNIANLFTVPLAGVRQRFPGIWSFALSTNISLTIRSSAQQLDTLLVGALAGQSAAGLYHIAKRVGRMSQQIGTQVQAVVFPEIAGLVARKDYIKVGQAVRHVETMLLMFGIGAFATMLVIAKPLLRIIAGTEFVSAAPLLIVQMLAVAFTISGSAARSALLALGREKLVLAIVLAGTVCFHMTALLLIPRIGAMGANVAHVLFGLIWLIGLTVALRKTLPALNPVECGSLGRPG